MTETSELPLADTSDMVELHRVFRNALARAAETVGTAAEKGEPEPAGTYYDNVLRLLHAHHQGEDLLLTPKLVERHPEEADLIKSVAGEHEDLLVDLGAAESALAAWRGDTTGANTSALVVALADLDAALTAHLDAEEQQILPIAGTCVNVAEWGELPSHGLSAFDGDKPWLVLGLIRAEMSAEHLADMDAHLPPPVQEMWREVGEGLYRELMSELDT